jgi:hypothetical protein
LRNSPQQWLCIPLPLLSGNHVDRYHQFPHPLRMEHTALDGEDRVPVRWSLPSQVLPGVAKCNAFDGVSEGDCEWQCPQRRKGRKGINYTNVKEIMEIHLRRFCYFFLVTVLKPHAYLSNGLNQFSASEAFALNTRYPELFASWIVVISGKVVQTDQGNTGKEGRV